MALTPQPDNLTDRLRRLEDRVDQIARGPVSPYRYADWPATQASDWDPLPRWTFNRQHPRVHAYLYVTTDNADTTGEARLRDVGANTVLGTVPVKFEKDAMPIGPVAMPGTFGDIREVYLEAHRTAGTGNVRATIAYATGMQS